MLSLFIIKYGLFCFSCGNCRAPFLKFYYVILFPWIAFLTAGSGMMRYSMDNVIPSTCKYRINSMMMSSHFFYAETVGIFELLFFP